jgi:23S rRNA (cytosine1962-C5)-methyltransferase
VPAVDEFFAARLGAAVAQRRAFVEVPRGVRLVHGDADWLPGLVVDQYGDCLVLQSTTAAIEQNLSSIVPWLTEHLAAVSVLARHDLQVRKREGLPLEVRLLEGKRVEESVIQEDGVRHRVKLHTGQKTGFFLDQRPARRRVRELAAGRRVLDLFCYQGGFSLASRRGGAAEVVALDSSAGALEQLGQAVADNDLGPVRTLCADAFDWLRQARGSGERFDLIVLDPPAFARSKRELDGALQGYRDLNRQALRMLTPGGILVTCACSHHVTAPRFEGVLRQAAAELPFPVVLQERHGAGADHPVSLSVPESEYLQVVVLRRPAGASP